MALLGYLSKEITYPQFFCGGSLITEQYVLTAAHCAKVLTALPTSYKNDIALIRLAEKLPEFNEFIRPICLPFDLKANENFLMDKTLEIAGWGKTITAFSRIVDILQHATMKAWDSESCMKDIPQKLKPIGETQICASGSDFTESCKGDSGSPLTLKEVRDGHERAIQVGIVSVKAMDSCGTQQLPSIFTRVDTYLGWII